MPTRMNQQWRLENLRLPLGGINKMLKRKSKNDFEECTLMDATHLSSQLRHGDHHVLVLDIEHSVEVVRTNKAGHHHVYINKSMPWEKYVKIIEAMADAGVVDEQWATQALTQGYAHASLPAPPRSLDG